MAPLPQGLAVLIAEDDGDLREALRFFFSQLGCICSCAENGIDAMKFAAERRPDLLVTDFQMPALDGLELIQLLKADAPDLPVVFTTGRTEGDHLQAVLNYSKTVVVKKPFQIEALLQACRSVLA